MTRLERCLLRLAQLTVLTLLLVVLAGAVVRATGSGMGCPDWPRCFGRLIPPTDVSQLPADYKTHYPGQEIADFNAFKTWTEYLNRLLGATSGFLLLATLLLSLVFWKRDRLTPLILMTAMALSGLVIWLGKTVVDQNLRPRQVTLHMLGGLALVMGTIVATTRLRRRLSQLPLVAIPPGLRRLLVAALFLVISQVLLGTQMRERVDVLRDSQDCCSAPLEDSLGGVYLAHRLVAALVVFSLGASFFWLRACARDSLGGAALRLGALVGLSYGIGVLLIRLQLPAALQPAHLVLAVLLMGTLVALLGRTCRTVD